MAKKKNGNHTLSEGSVEKIEGKVKNSLKKAKTNILPSKEEEYFKLAELVEGSRILFRTRTVFPFDFFPDDLIVDKDKVAIITKYFIFSDRYKNILIKNISDVYVENAVLFSTLYIYDKYFADSPPIKIDYLKKKEAIRVRDIIQGLIICHERKVDISQMKAKEVLPYLEEIGRATAK